MLLADIDGVQIEYDSAGAGEAVLLVHGILIAEAFDPLIRAWPLTNGYQLISYRRRGYGKSSKPVDGFSIAAQAVDSRALLRHLGIVRAHVVGHSLGGAIALQLALDAPEVVQSLALLEAALMVRDSGPVYRESLASGVQQYHEDGAERVVDAMLSARLPGYRAGLARHVPGAFESALAGAKATYEVDLPALLEWTFGEAEAKRIGQPVLSVLGAESVALNPRFADAHTWSLEHFLDAESFVLPRAHHFLQMENPEDMAPALASFFARHAAHRLIG